MGEEGTTLPALMLLVPSWGVVSFTLKSDVVLKGTTFHFSPIFRRKKIQNSQQIQNIYCKMSKNNKKKLKKKNILNKI